MPVIFKGSVMNNVSLSASNLILNHKNNESYYYHTTLIRLLRFQVNIYPANYYYHDSNGSFIIRTGCLFELLGDYTGKFWLFYIKKWCFQQSIQNKRTSILHWARSPFLQNMTSSYYYRNFTIPIILWKTHKVMQKMNNLQVWVRDFIRQRA